MRHLRPIVVTSLLALAVLLRFAPAAYAGSHTFTSSTAIAIPSEGAAAPYPSTINVSGVLGTLTKVTVSLANLSHWSLTDVDIVLAGPDGHTVVLMSDVGSNITPDDHLNLTFDDAGAVLPSDDVASGTYKPTDVVGSDANCPNDVYPAPAPAPSGNTTMAAAFNGLSGAAVNGAWKLFVVDSCVGFDGSIAGGWSLALTTSDAPVAANDSYITATNIGIINDANGGLLANDTNPLQATMTIATNTAPAHGTLDLGADGSFSYTPADGFVGVDSFTYRATNGAGTSNVATVTIDVGGAPHASDGALTVDEDASGHSALVATSGNNSALTYTIVGQPAHGTVIITNAATGAYTYTPLPNYSGEDSFTFKASAASAPSNVATVSVTVNAVNDTPVNSVPGAQTTPFNTALAFSVAKGNAISISDVDAGNKQVSVVLTAVHGSLTFDLPNASTKPVQKATLSVAGMNILLSKLVFVPEQNYAGPASITIETNDKGNTGSGGPLVDTDTINITVGKGNQTITFANPGPHKYGDAPIVLNATASSGLPVSYSVVSGPATLDGNLLKLTGAGSVTVRASQSGNNTYNAAPPADQTFAVAKAHLTIQADDKTKREGAANPLLTASYEGFVNADGAASLDTPVSLSTNATQNSPYGAYDIVASGAADADYDITFLDGVLIVSPKLVPTITWADPDLIIYGTPLGAAQLNASANVPGTFSYGPATGEVLHVGFSQPLAVTFTPDDSATYERVYYSVAIDVLPAELTITIDNKVKVYGDALPAFTASYEGFVNGDTPASLDVPLQFHSAGSASSDAGSYGITGSAYDQDYLISITQGTLIILPAPLTVTADTKTKHVGTENPQLTASFDGFVNGDFEGNLDTPVSLSTTATQNSPVGSYAITASGAADANYAITFVDGTLEVTELRVPAITWNDPEPIVYGTPLGAAQLNATANVPGTLSYLPTPGHVLRAGYHTLHVVFYPNDAENYAPIVSEANIQVLPATLTVTVANATKQYGAPLPHLSASFEGFVNGEDQRHLDVPLQLWTTATSESDVGGYSISARIDDSDYLIDIVPGTLTVTPAPLSVTADTIVKHTGNLNPPLTASYEGFVNGDDEHDLDTPVQLSTTATQASAAGNYPITASGAADDNYVITFVPGTLTVTDKKVPLIVWANPAAITYGTPLGASQLNAVAKDGAATVPGTFAYAPAAGAVLHAGAEQGLHATFTPADTATYATVMQPAHITVNKKALTITLGSITQVYGGAMPVAAVSYEGFVNGDDKDDLDAPFDYTTDATDISGVGSYVLEGTAGDRDYSITIANGTHTITPAPLKITADDKVRKVGTPNPQLTASYEGLVNGDDEHDLRTPARLSTTATQASPVGVYPIGVSSAAADNYTITFVSGTLTVTDKKVPLIVWANPAAITYGTPLGASQLNAVAKDGAATVPGTFAYAPAAGAVLHAGNAKALHVTFTPADTSVFAVVTAEATIDVHKAALTITADNKTVPQGGALPALTASYSGFVNGDTAAVLDTPVKLTTAAASSPIGSYPIVASGAADADYNITHVNGTLTIGTRPATVYTVLLPIVRK